MDEKITIPLYKYEMLVRTDERYKMERTKMEEIVKAEVEEQFKQKIDDLLRQITRLQAQMDAGSDYKTRYYDLKAEFEKYKKSHKHWWQ